MCGVGVGTEDDQDWQWGRPVENQGTGRESGKQLFSQVRADSVLGDAVVAMRS